jgi:molybdenum cofactor cytidylyltransferase
MKNISAIVLAAGLSTRMGKFKQLLPFRGKTVIEALVEALIESNIESIVIVTGHRAKEVQQIIAQYKVDVIFNPNYNEGMHTSVMKGVEALSARTDKFMVVLGDQPHLKTKMVNDLIDFSRTSPKGIIVPSFSHRRGHPVLFDKKYIQPASNLNTNTGLKQLLKEHEEDIDYYIVPDSNILFDIDTPDDYEELLKRHNS